MCGISGVFSPAGKKEELAAAVGAMNSSQALRGPDDEGFEDLGAVVFGHRRLSIIDLSSDGHQPMDFEGISITFNGEIYNFEEIKKKLADKNYKFRTKSDTEVILAAYKEYGAESFKMLRGMFAFALWDEPNKKLFLVRDRYGIKPLYYYSDKEKLIFASTVGAIEKSGLVKLVKNEEAYIAFLLLGSVPLPWTTFKEINSVPAGAYLVREGNEEKTVRYYDSLSPFLVKQKVSFKEASRGTRELLEEAVRLHMISDAPLGVFLSGGIDSSALAILAAEERKSPLSTLAIDFEEKEFSEKKYRLPVTSKIRSDHTETKVVAREFYELLEDIFKSMDQPTVDGVNTYFIARAAKDAGLKAVLSGLGSDEIFMGYPSFRRIGKLKTLQSLPFAPKILAKLLNYKSGAEKLDYLSRSGPLYPYLAIRGLFTPKEVAKILKISEAEVWGVVKKLEAMLPQGLEKLDPADLLSYLEVNFYMANQLLKDADFMSMRHSIETRVPFLDHELVEYTASLPVELKLGGYPKRLLIEALGADLPREVWDRPKMGFTFPFAEWLKTAPAEVITGGDEKIKESFMAGKTHWSRFWATIVRSKFK